MSESNFRWNHQLFDFSGLVSKKVGLINSISIGYLYRARHGRTANRIIQQYAIVQRLAVLRLSHRFASDQTFEKDQQMTWRWRYRLSTLLPLNGQSIDNKELYLKASNEFLYAIEDGPVDLEIRLNVFIGFQFTDNSKLEFGFDNRFDSFINVQLETKTWFNIIWYVAL